MRPEYDFSKGVREKHANRHSEGMNVALLDPDDVAAFPDSESVNKALRSVIAARTNDDPGPGELDRWSSKSISPGKGST